MTCGLCGGSGVLNIESVGAADAPWRLVWAPVKYASSCHGCLAGAAWREAGLE